MSSMLAELEQKAAEMSPEERAELALFLIQSLDSPEKGDIEEAWRIEAERRLAEIEGGKAESVPGDEVIAKIRQRLGC